MAEEKIRIEDDFLDLNFNSGPLEDRFRASMATLAASPNKSIFGSSKNRNEAKLTSRMLSNDRFDFGAVKKAHKAATIQRIVDSQTDVILAVQETTVVKALWEGWIIFDKIMEYREFLR
jgi:hypothetical protein